MSRRPSEPWAPCSPLLCPPIPPGEPGYRPVRPSAGQVGMFAGLPLQLPTSTRTPAQAGLFNARNRNEDT